MRKVIILPVYKDRHTTRGWEEPYIKNPALGQLLVYEKDSSLKNGESVKTSEGYRIPLIGRSSYAFICYVCDHYEDLADVICLTKTHVAVQKIFIHDSIHNSHLFDHFEFWNDCRAFVWIHPSRHEEYVCHLKKHNLIGPPRSIHNNEAFQPFSALSLEVLAGSTAGGWAFHEPKLKIISDSSRWIEGQVGVRMRQVWPDWQVPDVYVGRQEHCWSIKKEIILQHPKELYLAMRDETTYHAPPAHESGYWSWGLHHDQWCEFWPLFWDETIKRMKQKLC